jgi:hypothetical protein
VQGLREEEFQRGIRPQFITIPPKKNSTLHNLKNRNLTSFTFPKKIASFLSQLHIVFPCSHLSAPLKAQYQSFPRITTHTHHKDYQLSNKDSAPSPKLAHQSPPPPLRNNIKHNNLQNNKTKPKIEKKTRNWTFNTVIGSI